MATECQLHWLVGFYEGEGYCQLNATKYFSLCIVQVNKEPLDKTLLYFGGKITGPYTRGNPKHQPIYRWSIRGREARDLAILMMPHLSARRQGQIKEKMDVATFRTRAEAQRDKSGQSYWTARFLSMIDKTSDCWIWTGPLTKKGYPRFNYGSGMVLARRRSWEMVNGRISRDVELASTCGDSLCVNPSHMGLFDRSQSQKDVMNKKREDRRRLLYGPLLAPST